MIPSPTYPNCPIVLQTYMFEPEDKHPMPIKTYPIEISAKGPIFIHQYANYVTVEGLGQKLTPIDIGTKFVRVKPVKDKIPQDWTYALQASTQSAEEETMMLYEITNKELVFIKEGIYTRFHEFDILTNDGFWLQSVEYKNLIRTAIATLIL